MFAVTIVCASELTVRSCDYADEWFAQVVKASAKYTHINISNSAHLDMDCLKFIGFSPSHKYLQDLSMADCPELNTGTLRYICTKCVALTSLDISGNERLRSDVCEIVLSRLPNLRTFKGNRLCISDSSCDAIAASELIELEMVDTYGYTDNGLTALMDGCYSESCILATNWSILWCVNCGKKDPLSCNFTSIVVHLYL